LFLFGLGNEGAGLDDKIHRAEVAWKRGDELNARSQ
jgi:hypothetical protein